MRFLRRSSISLLMLAWVGVWSSPAWSALIPGLISDFESGGLEGWGGNSQPMNIADGGPGGAGDNFLQIGGGNRFATRNTSVNGTIDVAVTAIQVDLMRPATDPSILDMRLVLFGPGAFNRWTSTLPSVIPNDGIWATYTFSILEEDLTQVLGSRSYAELTRSLNRIMFRHDPAGPSAMGISAPGTLGIDNVMAVPEPSTALLLAAGLVGLGVRRRRRGA